MIYLVVPDFDPYPEDAPFCTYCDTKIGEGESVILLSETAHFTSVMSLHKNCVVAFTARILNEFEKL